LLDIIAGTWGGIAGKIIEFPFDTVKVRMQAGETGACGSVARGAGWAAHQREAEEGCSVWINGGISKQ